MSFDIKDKLAILADAAKYDASCASSAAPRKDSLKTKGIGSTGGSGICHAYAPDGRCISLLKILLTNFCMYDCKYCINRVSSNVRRARFTVDEVVNLTMAFYKRNYIEGLFLSSGIIKSPDYTMEQIARVAQSLREDHSFRGYIHLKTIPDADPALIEMAGRYADRLSINIELPTSQALETFAPEKRMPAIKQSMGRLRHTIEVHHGARKESPKAPRFAPAGQSTQVIVGADTSRDMDILRMSGNLYASYRLKRVYYSRSRPFRMRQACCSPRRRRSCASIAFTRRTGSIASTASPSTNLRLPRRTGCWMRWSTPRHLGRLPTVACSRGREHSAARNAAAGAGAGREGGGAYPDVARVSHLAARRSCAAHGVGEEVAALGHGTRLDAGRHARRG